MECMYTNEQVQEMGPKGILFLRALFPHCTECHHVGYWQDAKGAHLSYILRGRTAQQLQESMQRLTAWAFKWETWYLSRARQALFAHKEHPRQIRICTAQNQKDTEAAFVILTQKSLP